MYNIVLCCVSALSSSVMVRKIREEVIKNDVNALVWSVGETGLDLAWSDADVVLLTPQVRHLEKNLLNRNDRHVPVSVISEDDFANMNGEAVLAQALKAIEDSKK